MNELIANSEGLKLEFSGLGHFGSLENTKTVYIGIKENQLLEEITQAVEGCIAASNRKSNEENQ